MRPPGRLKASDTARSNVVSLGAQKLALDLQVAAEPAERPAGGDDPVAGRNRIPALAQDTANGTMRAR
jgi:hypothetical protein